MTPGAVGDESPESGNDCPAGVDYGHAFFGEHCVLNARSHIVDTHFHGVVPLGVQQRRVHESGTDVGDSHVHMLLVSQLVDCLKVGPLIALGG